MTCYCGQSRAYQDCCQPFHKREAIAQSPEQLMRSRYSAYATKQAQYLFETYAKESQQSQSIDEIREWAEQTQWLKLAIIDSEDKTLNDPCSDKAGPLPWVKFSALYIHKKALCQMIEISRFIIEDGQWKYLDGDISQHQQLTMPKRNSPCPCESGKKFKQCCLNKF